MLTLKSIFCRSALRTTLVLVFFTGYSWTGNWYPLGGWYGH